MNLNRYSVQLVKESTAHYEAPKVGDADTLYAIIRDALQLDTKLQEEFHIIMLNAKMKPIGSALIGMGGIASCPARIADIFRPAILKGAYAIALTHNHPSGETTPSVQDDALTKMAIDAGKILGVEVVDHIICGDGYYSYRANRPEIF